MSVSRNDPCPCGSGKKYKHCHLGKEEEVQRDPMASRRPLITGLIIAVLALSAILGAAYGSDAGTIAAGLGLTGVAAFFILGNLPPPGGTGKDPGAINFGG